MQIKFINVKTLETQIINISGAEVHEILEQAGKQIPDIDVSNPVRKDNLFKLGDNYIADIVYYGKPKAQQNRGRKPMNWDEKLRIFNEHYTKYDTAASLAAKSGLSTPHVYYLSKISNQPLVKQRCGRK